MANSPNPTLTLTVNTQGLAPAPAGGGNVGLVIGTTQNGTFSGAPGQGPVGISNLQTLTANYGSYGNAVDAAALDLAVGASEVILYKAFAGTVNGGNWTHVGTGSGNVSVSANNPLAPYGTPTATGSTGIEILILSSTTFAYSLDGAVTFSSAVTFAASTTVNIGTLGSFTGVSVAFSSGTYVANDTYIQPITATLGLMYPYGAATSTFVANLKQTTANGSTTVVGEGTFTAGTGTNPLDNFNVVIQIITSGTSTLGTAQYVYSLDGGVTFSALQTMPVSSGNITLAGGIILTPADTGGPGGSIAGFQAGELYKFSTQGPQLVEANITNILNSLAGNPNIWGWVHIAQACNQVGTGATNGFSLTTLFTDVDAAISGLFAGGRYVGAYAMIDSPPDTTTNNIDASLEAFAASHSSDYITVGIGGAAATVSPANGWQLARGSAFSISARAGIAPIGQDLAWVGAGPLVGISQLYRNEANTPGLGPVGLSPLWTIAGVNGFFITNANILCSNVSDITLAQYRRVINAACQAARTALVQFLSAGVRLTATGKIDPRDIAIIQNTCNSYVLSAINGQASGANTTVSNTLGAGGLLSVTVSVTPFGYAKQISVTVGFVNPALSAQAA